MHGASPRTHRSDRRRERSLAVYGPLSVIGLLTLWAVGLVTGFALLQWSQRELLLNMSGDPHFFDDLYMSATYEPYIGALSSRLAVPVPRWRTVNRIQDNWQTDPAGDGGPHF